MSDYENNLSDETLNAFVDDELGTAERSQVLAALARDHKLRARVCGLRAMQDQIRNAYYEPPYPARSPEVNSRRTSKANPVGWPQALAAVILLMLGAGAGWMSGVSYKTPQIIQVPPGEVSFQAARVDGAQINARNVMVHVNSAEPARLAHALDTAENVLSDKTGGKRIVMILANEGGIDLLRTDKSPYSKRIEQMLAKYPNVTLVACRNGVENLRRKSITVSLLPGARIGDSAVDEIVSHLNKGWLYIKV